MYKQNAREYLLSLYDDYRNNYLTSEKFAEHNGLTVQEGIDLLNIARSVVSHKNPDA